MKKKLNVYKILRCLIPRLNEEIIHNKNNKEKAIYVCV